MRRLARIILTLGFITSTLTLAATPASYAAGPCSNKSFFLVTKAQTTSAGGARVTGYVAWRYCTVAAEFWKHGKKLLTIKLRPATIVKVWKGPLDPGGIGACTGGSYRTLSPSRLHRFLRLTSYCQPYFKRRGTDWTRPTKFIEKLVS
jgi:hypothetical protein